MSTPSGPGGGLLAVHAHPDDETLSNGALLATWAATGRPVTVVTCTRGEQGEVIGRELAHLAGDGRALAEHREGELARALAALGVGDHQFLDQVPLPDDGSAEVRYLDSGMAWAAPGQAVATATSPPGAFSGVGVDEAAARLAVVIAESRPAVVVGYEPGGGYGHPDHVHAHRVMHRAVERAADEHQVSAILWTVLDEDAWHAACAALGAAAQAPFTAPDPVGGVSASAVPRAQIDLVVPVAPVLDRVLAALRAHATQVQAVARWAESPLAVARFALSNRVLQPVLSVETYRLARLAPRGVADRATADRLAGVAWPTGVQLDGG